MRRTDAPDLSRLTPRQRELFEYIKSCILTKGYPPTIREVANEMGIGSPNGVVCHVTALEKKGFISRSPNSARAITLVGYSQSTPNSSGSPKTAATASLTTKQQRIFEFIAQSIHRHGYPPTVREMCDEFAIASPNGVMSHLRALEAKGVIHRDSNVARGIRLGSKSPTKNLSQESDSKDRCEKAEKTVILKEISDPLLDLLNS